MKVVPTGAAPFESENGCKLKSKQDNLEPGEPGANREQYEGKLKKGRTGSNTGAISGLG